MATTKGGIVTAQQNQTVKAPHNQSISALINSMLDREGMRKRFDELMGRRAPQFISAVVSLITADENLQKAFRDAPMTIIQAAIKAATFDLPIDPNLGYAYIVPFKNNKSGNGRMEAHFIMGYKGMNQLALRSGVYKKINVIDVRQGELVSYNRLTEDIEIKFIEDDIEREKLPIIGWCGYYKLLNGMEKTIYMTKKQIQQHEAKNRKGKYIGKGWREDFENMASKTVFRRLIGKWGIMSIDYQSASPSLIAAAEAVSKGEFDDDDTVRDIDTVDVPESIDTETGEIKQDDDHAADDATLDAALDNAMAK